MPNPPNLVHRALSLRTREALGTLDRFPQKYSWCGSTMIAYETHMNDGTDRRILSFFHSRDDVRAFLSVIVEADDINATLVDVHTRYRRTTADYRNLALEAEQACKWQQAADFWQAALDNYPPTPGALAKRDQDMMRNRVIDCRIYARR